ncbi:MAG: hypothetical protein JW717_03590 [Marinilabiliaceae bacterium]|nr:hypothetical protein [Marinilabiliaceae bacterium]
MKNLLLSFLVIASFSVGYSQDFSKLDSVELTDYEHYKNAEPKVLECCEYLLAKPFDKKDENREFASKFLIRWMEGTPEYTFEIDATAEVLTEKKAELLQIYLAAMTKVYLTTKDGRVTKDKMNEQTVETFINYCVNEGNELKLSKELKKIIKERSVQES